MTQAERLAKLTTPRTPDAPTKRERYLARRQCPAELTAELVNARLEVNDWHACATPDELARWRAAQQRLIDAAEAVGQASVHSSRALMAEPSDLAAQIRALPRCKIPPSGDKWDEVVSWADLVALLPPEDGQP